MVADTFCLVASGRRLEAASSVAHHRFGQLVKLTERNQGLTRRYTRTTIPLRSIAAGELGRYALLAAIQSQSNSNA